MSENARNLLLCGAAVSLAGLVVLGLHYNVDPDGYAGFGGVHWERDRYLGGGLIAVAAGILGVIAAATSKRST